MTDHDHTTEEPDVLDGWEIPADWTDTARDLFAEVLAERPDLGGADLGALQHAAALTSAADRLDEVARAAGYVSSGSTGQPTVHPAVVESRLARTAAASILNRLSPTTTARNTERATRAARARWSGSVPIGLGR